MIAITLWWLKAKVWFDGIATLATLFCVPALIVSGGLWLAGFGHSAYVSSRESPQVFAHAGGVSEIDTDLEVKTDSPKLVYNLRLVSEEGVSVYTYPTSEVLTEMPALSKIFIQVPESIQAGTYSLYTDVTYFKNPISAGVISTKVASLKIN